MKKLYSLLVALLAMVTISAQLTVSESGGILTFSYNGTGENPNWSTFDPQGANTIYVYSWLNAVDTSTNTAYNDNWSNVVTTLTYNTSTGKFEGTLNLNNYSFTNTNNTVPQGTTISNFNFILRNQAGTKQSGDLKASNYGLTVPFVLNSLAVNDLQGLSKKSVVSQGKLYTSKKGNLDIQVYDFSGKVVKSMKVNANGNPIDVNLAQKGLYLMKITDGVNSEVVKFSY